MATAAAMHLLVDFRYQEAVRQLQQSPSACPICTSWQVPASYDEALLDCLAEIGVSTAGFEAGHLTVARHEWLAHGRGARRPALDVPADASGLVEQARVIKDAGGSGDAS